ncbi:MAG: hypothetical protein KOO62_02415 [candidate division Zixibacteria bacterium]|nr:hypothetical protein [candidate division Zixibacteria bacterium]
MHKKILLAEQSDATRGVAEMVLRQNGFEVISVSTGEKALEVLEVSRPDLIIAGAEMPGHGNRSLHQCLQSSNKTRTIPLMLFADSTNSDLPYPDEIIIRRPVDSKDLAEKARVFSGQTSPETDSPAGNVDPLAQSELDDELLDAALGLDQIDVMESEILSQTKGVPIGEHSEETGDPDKSDQSGRIESIIITEDQTDIHRPKTKTSRAPKSSSTGKLDILENQDQYSVGDMKSTPNSPHADHDYEWFISEMQNDTPEPSSSLSVTSIPSGDDHKLTFEDPSETMDPITPVESGVPNNAAQPDGVNKFISEFRREVEKFHSDESESPSSSTTSVEQEDSSVETAWEETFEQLTPSQVELFTRRMAKDIGERIAQIIIDKIDSEKLTNLIKDEILNRIKSTSMK